VVVAVPIGGIKGLGLIGDQFGFLGSFWDGVGVLNDNFNSLGFVIIGVFIVGWVGSAVIYRYKGLDLRNSLGTLLVASQFGTEDGKRMTAA
jgi:high-affinity nickel-transport protein